VRYNLGEFTSNHPYMWATPDIRTHTLCVHYRTLQHEHNERCNSLLGCSSARSWIALSLTDTRAWLVSGGQREASRPIMSPPSPPFFPSTENFDSVSSALFLRDKIRSPIIIIPMSREDAEHGDRGQNFELRRYLSTCLTPILAFWWEKKEKSERVEDTGSWMEQMFRVDRHDGTRLARPTGAANRLAIRLKTDLEGGFPGVRDPRSEPRITSLHRDYLPPLLRSEMDLFFA